jgi:hypothetical protein
MLFVSTMSAGCCRDAGFSHLPFSEAGDALTHVVENQIFSSASRF